MKNPFILPNDRAYLLASHRLYLVLKQAKLQVRRGGAIRASSTDFVDASELTLQRVTHMRINP